MSEDKHIPSTVLEQGNTEGNELIGQLIAGIERVRSSRAAEYFGLKTSETETIKSRMYELGWRGPKKMHTREGSTQSCYYRVPMVRGSSNVISQAALPRALQEGCELSITWCHKVLARAIDVDNGNLCRAQQAAASMMLSGQLRADEARLRAARTDDVLERLEKLLRETEKRIPLEANALPPKD